MAEAMLHRLKRPFARAPSEEMWALNDISFDIPQGAIVGFSAATGRARASLLKVLSRIAEPTTARRPMAGRVSSLIRKLGTGFRPEAHAAARYLSERRDPRAFAGTVARQFDGIVRFFSHGTISWIAVKYYSSGIYCAWHSPSRRIWTPYILFVEKSSSVGDSRISEEILGQMSDVANCGRPHHFRHHSVERHGSPINRGIFFRSGG